MEIFCGKNVIGCYCPAIKRKKRTCAWNVRKGNEQNKTKVINKDASFMQAKAYMFLRRKLADHFIVVWLSPKSIFTFVFSPHSFLTGTNELAQTSADNSLCYLAGRILHLYSEGYRFVTLKNVLVVILLYFSFLSVIRRRGDCLRRICIVTSKVCDDLLSSVTSSSKFPLYFFSLFS